MNYRWEKLKHFSSPRLSALCNIGKETEDILKRLKSMVDSGVYPPTLYTELKDSMDRLITEFVAIMAEGGTSKGDVLKGLGVSEEEMKKNKESILNLITGIRVAEVDKLSQGIIKENPMKMSIHMTHFYNFLHSKVYDTLLQLHRNFDGDTVKRFSQLATNKLGLYPKVEIRAGETKYTAPTDIPQPHGDEEEDTDEEGDEED